MSQRAISTTQSKDGFVHISAPGLAEKLDAGFELRPEFVSLAEETIRKVVELHEKKLAISNSKKKKKSKKEKKPASKDYTFVGIHSRYSIGISDTRWQHCRGSFSGRSAA